MEIAYESHNSAEDNEQYDESLKYPDKPGEECGVFGIFYNTMGANNDEAARSAFFALYALQHRGQESAGIASSDGRAVYVHRGMGLVSQVFTEATIKTLRGHSAIGHTRYSTEGGSELKNAQPFVIETAQGFLGLAHNGTITKYYHLRQKVLNRGIGLFTTSDSELIAQALANVPAAGQVAGWEGSIANFMTECEGAFALSILTHGGLFGVRDRFGLRPLCIGELPNPKDPTQPLGYALASESCALATIGARYLREVRPGEIVRIDNKGMHSMMGCTPAPKAALCSFEYVYFARPDSLLEDQLVHAVRQELGRVLAREAPTPNADVVVPVPDSSFPAAIAYAAAAGIPFMEGLTKNRYIGRTFIQPDQRLRQKGIMLKFNPLPQNLAGKNVVLIDDSIVRGNTLGPIIKLLRELGGAKSVHVRISSPPVKHPCFMGIDMSTYEELIAHKKTVAEICAHTTADSLAYISLEGMLEALRKGLKPQAEAAAGHCHACWSGKYPIDIEDTTSASCNAKHTPSF